MKKIFTILSIVLLGAIACTKSNFDEPKAEESGLVEVTMTMTLPNWLMAETKAGGVMAHKPDIDNIRVAMFGTSGYPQAYTKATLTGTTPTENDTEYTFTVLLPVYEGEAHVHVIANGDDSIPFEDQTEHTIMSKMTTTGGVGAYWARIVLPNGVLAQWTDNGTMQTNDNHNFVPTAETLAKFQHITLIRNFAEVKLVQVPDNLTNVTYTLVNVPKTGSVAPIQRTYTEKDEDGNDVLKADYIDTYAQYDYNTATEKMTKEGAADYNGYVVDTDIVTTIPADNTFVEYDGATGLNGAFVYERPVATANTTCLLIKGTYMGSVYYYRLDLLGKNQPLALYRNYQYQIRIGRLGGKGYTTAAEALKHNSSDNVSASVEAKTLTDISDGSSRLEVEYIEKNFVIPEGASATAKNKTFWVSYKPVASGAVDNTNVTVEGPNQVEILKPDGTGTGTYYAPAITSASITKGTESDGKLYFNFTLDEQGTEDKVSTFVVKAHNNSTDPDYYSELSRVVTVRVIKKMTMEVTLDPAQIEGGKDKTTVLNIALSDTLQGSMFPLEFYIEDTNHTLNPTGYDGPTHTAAHAITVPVKVDKSIVDGTSKSFYFIRTVNWSEYEPMLEAYKAGNTGAIVFQTEFKTLVDDSATDVYVANEYFNSDDASLTNTPGTVRKTGSFTFKPAMFSTTDRTETSTDGHVTVTFSNVVNAGATAVYIQLANTNTQPTATFTTDATNTRVTRVSMDFTSDENARGTINANSGSVSGRNQTSPYTRYWPASGTASSNNLILTFTRYNNSNNNHHRFTSITVEYEYYE